MTDFWKGRRVLITGMAGFVGANLSRRLADLGAEVYGWDLVTSSPGLKALDVSLMLHMYDIRRIAPVWYPPQVVFHLAGVGHISEAQRDPLGAWQVNVGGSWNMLELCHNLRPAGQIQAVVCASSNHVFGSLNPGAKPAGTAYAAVRQDSSRTAWLEDDPPNQSDVYSTSKAMVDLLVRAYGAMGLPVAALRHVNCFGPADPHQSHLVTGTICNLLEGKVPVIRSDGTPIKGYLHVDDVVSAYLILAQAMAEGKIERGLAFNAGPPGPISVLALVDLICQVTGHGNLVPEIRAEDLSQSGYVEHLATTWLRDLGWAPKWSLAAGIADTWAWYRTHGGMAWLSP